MTASYESAPVLGSAQEPALSRDFHRPQADARTTTSLKLGFLLTFSKTQAPFFFKRPEGLPIHLFVVVRLVQAAEQCQAISLDDESYERPARIYGLQDWLPSAACTM